MTGMFHVEQRCEVERSGRRGGFSSWIVFRSSISLEKREACEWIPSKGLSKGLRRGIDDPLEGYYPFLLYFPFPFPFPDPLIVISG